VVEGTDRAVDTKRETSGEAHDEGRNGRLVKVAENTTEEGGHCWEIGETAVTGCLLLTPVDPLFIRVGDDTHSSWCQAV